MNRAVFLDRDNTLIDNDGYLADPEQVRMLPGAAEAVSRFRKAGYYVIVVTNQSGVARGHFTEDQLSAVNQRMQDLLRAHGTGVDALYYCPYLPGPEAVVESYRKDSDLRKPKPGMLLLAAKDMDLDLAASWVVGDAERDIDAGRTAGCRTIRIRLPAGESTRAEMTAESLAAAADLVLNSAARAAAPASVGAGSGSGTSSPAPTLSAQTSQPDKTSKRTETASSTPANDTGEPMSTEALLTQILDELRTARRETTRSQFSAATLAGAVAQAFAVCSLGWALYAAVDYGGNNSQAYSDSILRLLAAIAFQLIALTWFNAGKRM